MKELVRVLLCGDKGQLGKSIKAILDKDKSILLKNNDIGDLDITDLDSVLSSVSAFKPDVIINAAAYTAVDKAETEIEKVFAVNADGPANLALAARENGSHLIHISTDYVYNSLSSDALKETSPTTPKGIYAKSKLQGEWRIMSVMEEYFILRTSWLYSEYGRNFVKTMLSLMQKQDSLSIVNDQFGSPTYASDLATFIHKIISTIRLNDDIELKKKFGVYNYSNSGYTNWYEFAVKIREFAGFQTELTPVSTDEYPSKTPRPQNSRFDNSKAIREFELQIPGWEESLEICIRNLLKTSF